MNVTDYIDQAINALNKLYGLPAVALVLGSCIAVGYALRFVKRFPNSGIPVAVILWGAIAMSLVADTRGSSMTLRIWIVRNVLVGLLIGFGAWIIHNMVLSRVEDWLAAKFPERLGNTDFFRRKNGNGATVTAVDKVPDPPQPPGP